MHRSTYTRTITLTFVFFLTAACGGDGEESDGSEPTIEAVCEQGCTVAASVGCPDDDASTCYGECLADAANTNPACLSQAKAAVACAVNQPASEWTCDAEEGAIFVGGGCDEEVGRLQLCYLEQADGACPWENDDECDDPTGTDLCPAGTDLVDCSSEPEAGASPSGDSGKR